MDFIKSFYYGDIIPHEYSFSKDEHYRKAAKTLSDNEEKLNKALSGEELALFKELMDAVFKVNAAGDLENFRLGFSLGVRLIYDSVLEYR